MTIVGLTGGIGSGKTTVATMFSELGVPVYIADVEAKRLMNSSRSIKKQLVNLFGEGAYKNKLLNREYIASLVFNDAILLDKMNSIVHPIVQKDFKKWIRNQTFPYIIKEAAIIFEHHNESEYDYIITVTAELEDKIDRILKRDATTKSKVMRIMDNQMSDAEKIQKSDFVILNDTLKNTKLQVLKIHEKILQNIDNF